MEYRCEDLATHGVILIPPTSPEFAPLLADIERRAAQAVPGGPPRIPNFERRDAPTMILCNRSQTGIAGVSWVWTLHEESGGSRNHSVSAADSKSLLSSFGLDDRQLHIYRYWFVILPGSKRAIRGSSMLGDNTDVRPHGQDEAWTGGLAGFGGGRPTYGPLRVITLKLDGVFFANGSFAGPDTLGTFDRVSADIRAHRQLAKVAQDLYDAGRAPAAILQEIESVSGAKIAPGKSDRPEDSPGRLAWQIAAMRYDGAADDQVVQVVLSWGRAAIPELHKL
jgi:hypothetical protein